MTMLELFDSAVIDMNVLSIAIAFAIIYVFADDTDYSPTGYRRQHIANAFSGTMGYLGRGHVVVPSCVVWAVRSCYPTLRWALPRV